MDKIAEEISFKIFRRLDELEHYIKRKPIFLDKHAEGFCDGELAMIKAIIHDCKFLIKRK